MMGLTGKKLLLTSLVIAVAIAILIGRSNGPAPIISTESERVQDVFQRLSIDVAKKDSVTSVKFIPVRVGVESFPDGTRASVWATGPMPSNIRSHCFYVDVIKKGSASGFGDSVCGEPTKEVSLHRIGSIVVGNVGTWAAGIVTVRVAVKGNGFDVPATSGYFVIPSGLSADPATKFTIALFSKGGWSQGIVTDLLAPGSETPSPLVLLHTATITPKKS
jgi:hypothetical protein